VAGKPILAHITDDLRAAGIESFVVVVGYEGESVREWFARRRPDLEVTFVEQRERLGLGHALWVAREAMGEEPFFCILGDTILKADYGRLLSSPHSMVAVREVDDPRRFGVVELAGDTVARFVEKPEVPRSNLAIVGAYLFHDGPALWRALGRVVREGIRTKGEFQLTDALQLMIEEGVPFGTTPVEDWYDCGQPETWLETNRALLPAAADLAAGNGVTPPCAIAEDVVLVDSRIGPHVSIGAGTRLEGCELANCIVGEGADLKDCRLRDSLVGEHCRLRGVDGSINVGDYGELRIGTG
jgi:glucose-1-phosphate thymidylyltransferase